MNSSSIYHGGGPRNNGFSSKGSGNGTVINLNSTGSFATKAATFSTYPQQSTSVLPGELNGLNHLGCDTVEGYDDRFKAVKLGASITGPITGIGSFIHSANANKIINFGIYTEDGDLIDSTGIINISPNENTFVGGTFLGGSVNIIRGVIYWLGVWADGADIPAHAGYSNFSSNFPDGSHCIQAFAIGGLPLSFSSTFPFNLNNNPAPINVS